jgi:hypothetical protein
MKYKTLSGCFGFLVLLPVSYGQADPPKGWLHRGSQPQNYDMRIDQSTVHGGTASAQINFIGRTVDGFGTLMQTFKADAYRGKRVRMSAWMKSENSDAAQLWMRLDGPGTVLGFDNMSNRAVKGTADWKKYAIVLQVPANTVNIAFGATVTGKGKAWVDDFVFEVVDNTIPPTNMKTGPSPNVPRADVPKQPVNLNFELK